MQNRIIGKTSQYLEQIDSAVEWILLDRTISVKFKCYNKGRIVWKCYLRIFIFNIYKYV